ncbi:MAG: SEC-C domain-containing protein, partial [Bacteroidales bacterium]|nr:SEC-C domain-containing protein [Bacteroidales bacterium]
GTERHDSRRVDRQLRGRAGRQGDPGSSTFYVSFEDDLMRLFGGEKMTRIIDRMGMKEGEVLQHSMLSGSIERAQKKVEENNFGIRKRLLEYDDVMNSQREVIYNKRRNALYGERIEVDVKNMIGDYADILAQSKDNYDYEGFSFELMRQLSIEPSFDEAYFKKASADDLSEKIAESIKEVIARKTDVMVKQAWPIIEQVYKTQGATYENIALPVSDGAKIMQLVINLKKAYENKGMELYRAMAKSVTLVLIDEYWKEHLREMDDLKQSVQNATYEQKDPLLIYKFESFNLFKGILEKISRDVLAFMTRAHIPLRGSNEEIPIREQQQRKRTDLTNMRTSRNDLVTNGGEPKSNAPVHVEKKVGRNDPCPCGSGKKYKNCHGKEN